MLSCVFVVLLLGNMWRGVLAHFKGHVEVTCILWVKQADVRHATSALQHIQRRISEEPGWRWQL